MRIGILQTGKLPETLAPVHGEYPDMFMRLLSGRGFDFRSWAVVDMEFPGSPHDADGWLITGSRHGAYESLPFIRPLEDFIRAVRDAGVPMVGICFGHQIIAQALGGRVEKFPGGWSVGAQDYAFDDGTMTLNAWHQDQVVARPPDARVIATSPFCENAALIYGDSILTVQAHPEIDNAYLAGLIREKGPGVVPEGQLAEATARIGTPLHDSAMADRIAAFFRQPRERTT